MNESASYLVIDIGTGNLRVALAGANGTILGIERENMPYRKDERYPEALCFEPDQVWELVLHLAGKVIKDAPGAVVKAITATSQREGIVLIGRQGEHLAGLPNIDHRGREWENILSDKSRVYQLTGRYPTSLFSAFKLTGVSRKQEDLWSRCSTFLSISDWVQFRFSGVQRYEHSQASETLLYDVAAKQWSEELCTLFGLSSSLLPRLQSSGTVLGPVLPEYASRLGISPETRVVVGGADTQLAVLGILPAVDDVVIVSGTTTPVIKVTGGYITDPEERTWTNRHITESDFILEANAGVTGLNYQRLKEIFYPNESYGLIEEELDADSSLLSMTGSPSLCMASLGSLVASEKRPLTKGGFIFDAPVSHQLTRSSFVRATLWDIACSIKENYDILCQVGGHPKDYLWACGGGMQSFTLRRFLAGLLNKKIKIRDSYRQSSVAGGVAVCNRALGKEACPPAATGTIEPQDHEQYVSLYRKWKNTRESFKQIFRHAD